MPSSLPVTNQKWGLAMPLTQTRAIIDRSRDFHEQVSALYHRMADDANQTRVRLLLDYMSQHEQRIAEALAEYEHDAPTKVLDSWLQDAGNGESHPHLFNRIRALQLNVSSDVDEVIALGVSLSEELIAQYRELADRAEPKFLREVFSNVQRMEEKALKQFVRDAGRLNDL